MISLKWRRDFITKDLSCLDMNALTLVKSFSICSKDPPGFVGTMGAQVSLYSRNMSAQLGIQDRTSTSLASLHNLSTLFSSSSTLMGMYPAVSFEKGMITISEYLQGMIITLRMTLRVFEYLRLIPELPDLKEYVFGDVEVR